MVITDCDHANLDPESQVFAAAGLEWMSAQARSEEDVIANCSQAVVLLNQYAPLGEDTFASLQHCQAVVRYGVGVDHIDISAATRHGVVVCNVPDYAVEEVSDHALALLLSLLRRTTQLDQDVRRGLWDVGRAGIVERFSDVVLGVVGVGRIGSALCRKARGVGFWVLGCDTSRSDEEIRHRGAEPVSFDELLTLASAISLHVPLDDTTRHLISASEIGRMPRGSVLVNTSRGGVIDESALMKALADGHLAGAGLDVLESEPMSVDHKFAAFNNVILTPHAAWYSQRAYTSLKSSAAEEAVRILRGNRPRHPLNPQVLSIGER